MPTLYQGSTGVRELSPRPRSSTRGKETARRWRGTLAECQAESENHAGRPMEIVEEEWPWFVLHVTYEGWPDPNDQTAFPTPDSQIVSLYQLRGSKLGKSIWEFPLVADEMRKIRDHGGIRSNLQGLAKFRSDFMALARGDATVFSAPDGSTHGEQKTARQVVVTLEGMLQVAQGFGCNTGVLLDFFDDLANGVDTYQVDAFVLRHRSVGPSNANLLPAYLEMNVPIRTSTLLGQLSAVPTGIRNVLPNGFWFAEAPVLDETDSDRLELVQEWKHTDNYSTFLYGQPR